MRFETRFFGIERKLLMRGWSALVTIFLLEPRARRYERFYLFSVRVQKCKSSWEVAETAEHGFSVHSGLQFRQHMCSAVSNSLCTIYSSVHVRWSNINARIFVHGKIVTRASYPSQELSFYTKMPGFMSHFLVLLKGLSQGFLEAIV